LISPHAGFDRSLGYTERDTSALSLTNSIRYDFHFSVLRLMMTETLPESERTRSAKPAEFWSSIAVAAPQYVIATAPGKFTTSSLARTAPPLLLLAAFFIDAPKDV
jgi:hypothetical protein